ncbi:cbb3-type cytochrome oxidase assembly protein CcoS [Stieleria sp. TO1_6]|uniref:cbb3-type cytochrome oxidase assembly protein CcoS n=1 Tax=Stieleria tagensis TaxID=2956795 RepID=UPI00209A720D|nr:cbb3-type cytochrome oxidase assembly protein CcoS [Stieleria tagensis]MCO8122454.1 cbb3-type cytochrome oxidase assembly protein CcoS [Stieleria tagensis]
MSVLYIALPVALLLGGGGLLACLYCIRNGQYDDLDTPAVRVLVDDQPIVPDTATDSAIDRTSVDSQNDL